MKKLIIFKQIVNSVKCSVATKTYVRNSDDCPGSSSSLYVRSIEYEESLRHYTHRHTHLLFESKREKQLGDTGDVEIRKSYL